jgi:glycosyltransferase involved in cell wall biosynthesis
MSQNKLHILFINSWYPSRVLPSNGDFIQRHAEAISLKHQVSVVHVITDNSLKKNIDVSDQIINNIRTLIAYVKPFKNPIKKLFYFRKAYKLLLKKVDDYDVVHVNKFYPAGIFAYFLKKKKGIPYIITEHHTLYHKPYNKQIGFIEKQLSKIIIKNASFVCPVSDNLGLALQDFGLKGNYFTVPNVVNTAAFQAKKEVSKSFTLLHVSSMSKVKNVKGILRVVKLLDTKIPDFKFYFIGGNAQKFKTYTKELQIDLNTISFINQLPHKDLISYFQKANGFILFSEVENLPCVILESFSCGTPVISTDVGGISEFFPNDYGLLIQPNDESALLKAILELYDGFKVAPAKKMHEYVVNHFSKEHICNEFTRLYIKSIH